MALRCPGHDDHERPGGHGPKQLRESSKLADCNFAGRVARDYEVGKVLLGKQHECVAPPVGLSADNLPQRIMVRFRHHSRRKFLQTGIDIDKPNIDEGFECPNRSESRCSRAGTDIQHAARLERGQCPAHCIENRGVGRVGGRQASEGIG